MNIENRVDTYEESFWDGYMGRPYMNPYEELSPAWVEYDKSYDDGQEQYHFERNLKYTRNE